MRAWLGGAEPVTAGEPCCLRSTPSLLNIQQRDKKETKENNMNSTELTRACLAWSQRVMGPWSKTWRSALACLYAAADRDFSDAGGGAATGARESEGRAESEEEEEAGRGQWPTLRQHMAAAMIEEVRVVARRWRWRRHHTGRTRSIREMKPAE